MASVVPSSFYRKGSFFMWSTMTIDVVEIVNNSIAFINAYWVVAALAIGVPFGLNILSKAKDLFN